MSSGAVALDVAHTVFLDALGPESAAAAFVDYYSVDGRYPGSEFLELGPFDNYSITSGDLVAIAMLGVNLAPRAVRLLLHPGAARSEISGLLAEESLSVDGDLRFATPQVLEIMAELHVLFTQVFTSEDSSPHDAHRCASALCTRKRPDLFPLTELRVLRQLGVASTRHERFDAWRLFGGLLDQGSVRDAIDVAEDRARTNPRVRFEGCMRRLRHLDIAVAMHVRSLGYPHDDVDAMNII